VRAEDASLAISVFYPEAICCADWTRRICAMASFTDVTGTCFCRIINTPVNSEWLRRRYSE